MILGDVIAEDINKILLISDHSRQVQIPVIMLMKNDSDYIRKLVEEQGKNGDIIVSVTFEIK